jgi:hypothetical protein
MNESRHRTAVASNALSWFYSRSHDAMIRVYDESGNVIETHSTRASSRSGSRSRLRHVQRGN